MHYLNLSLSLDTVFALALLFISVSTILLHVVFLAIQLYVFFQVERSMLVVQILLSILRHGIFISIFFA